MGLRVTTALLKIQALRRRLRICQGGARAGKTFAIMMCLIDLAQSHPKLVISVCSESFPHLRKGAMREFLLIMEERGYFSRKAWSKSEFTYTFPNGTIIEFFSVDQADKVRGPARDILFINECNNVPFETYRQLALRTRKIIYLDYNPVAEFWVHTELLGRDDADYAQLTYLDNEALDRSIVREIELLKSNPNLWRIYGLGETGVNEGQIFTNWDLDLLDEPPPEAELLRHGLDFGFTNDPSALVDLYRWNQSYILDEQLYATHQSNRDLANAVRQAEGLEPLAYDGSFTTSTSTLTIGDSSEPKSIDEISRCGVLIQPAVKGPDSVNHGIQLMQQQSIILTKRSLNGRKEYRNYLWKKDRITEKPLNVPVDAFNHFMDASRYAITEILTSAQPMIRVIG